jgi:hypothetical protein
MPWIVYETKNKINDKVYVGVHKQDGDEFDGYLGSGKSLAAAIGKYGRDNFERRTMFSFDNEQDAYACEAVLVTPEWCKRKDNYNMKPGGVGGWCWDWSDPEFRESHAARSSACMKALNDDPEFRAKAVARMKAMHADPEFRAKHLARLEAMHADPEFRAKHLARLKAMHADPEFRAKSAARTKAMHADPDFSAKNAARMKSLNADPEFKAKSAARMKAMNADPEFKAKQVAAKKAAAARRRGE